MAPFDIAPDDREMLIEAIEELGDQVPLAVMLAANGDTIDQVSASGNALDRIALDLVPRYCEQPEKLKCFLTRFCEDRPAIEAAPKLKALLAKVSQHVAMAPELALTRLSQSKDPEVQKLIAGAHEDLLKVEGRLLTLTNCKLLHDKLHSVQTETYEEIQRAALATDDLSPAELANVTTQADRIADFYAEASDLLLALGRAPQIANPAWLANVQSVLDLLRRAKLRSDVRAALFRLRTVLRQQLPRFDDAIVETADKVPFELAVKLLRQVAKLPLARNFAATIEGAATQLDDVTRELKATIALHRAWQAVDGEVWELERLLLSTGPQLPASESAQNWQQIDLSWPWIKQLLADARQGQAQANVELDGALADVDAAMAGKDADRAPLAAALSGAIRKIRLGFVAVDKALKGQCVRISALRDPILALVEDGDGN